MWRNPLTPQENQFLPIDGNAFQQLYHKHWEFLFRLACKKTGSAEDAYDLVHDLFAELLRNQGQWTAEGDGRAFLVSCLYHKIFNYFRSKGLREKHYKNLENFLSEIVQPAHTLAQEEQELASIHQALEKEITGMPEKMKKIFIRSHYHEQSIDQIAGDLSISRQTVKNQLHIAGKRIRRAMKQMAVNLLFSLL